MMKTYKIPYEFYPFNMEGLRPQMEVVEAENVEQAIEKVKEKHGSSAEVFGFAARKHYNE